MKSGVMITQMS